MMSVNEIDSSASGGRREVIQRELAWHEQEADRRIPLDKFLYDPPAFDQIVESALAFLDGRPGEAVLDMGCGEGKESMTMAAKGLRVIAMDLSHVQLSRARQSIRVTDPGLPVVFIQASAEQLPFTDGSFRIIHGKAILHHLDLATTSREIQRVLGPDGRATFAEPLAHHPLFWLGRRLTPSLRTTDEHPLTHAELRQFAGTFWRWQMNEAYLFTPVAYLFRLIPKGEPLFRRCYIILQRLDNWLLQRLTALRPLAWYGTVKVWKRITP